MSANADPNPSALTQFILTIAQVELCETKRLKAWEAGHPPPPESDRERRGLRALLLGLRTVVAAEVCRHGVPPVEIMAHLNTIFASLEVCQSWDRHLEDGAPLMHRFFEAMNPLTDACAPLRELIICSSAYQAAPSATSTVIISLGERQYQIGDTSPVTLEANEDNVLQAFLEQASMDGPRLIDIAGFEAAPRVLRSLCKKYDGRFGPAITLPAKKGQGGYHVAICLS
jgi:hypothetical protein